MFGRGNRGTRGGNSSRPETGSGRGKFSRGDDRGGGPPAGYERESSSYSGGGRGNYSGRGSYHGRESAPLPTYYDRAEFSSGAVEAPSSLSAISYYKSKNHIDSYDPILRPDYGRLGTRANVGTNFLKYDVRDIKIYTYRISFAAELQGKTKIKSAMLKELIESKEPFKSFAGYLGHNNSDSIYSLRFIPIYENRETFSLGDEGNRGNTRSNQITVTYQHILDMKDLLDYTQVAKSRIPDPSIYTTALGCILGYAASRRHEIINLNNNRFFIPENPNPVNKFMNGLILSNGFYSSVRLTFNSVLINLNTCSGVFYKSTNESGKPIHVGDLMAEFLGRSVGSVRISDVSEHLLKFVKGLRITRQHLKYSSIKSIQKIVNADSETFKFPYNGRNVSIAAYFKAAYNIILKHPKFPLINIGGNTNLPVELAFVVPGQLFKGVITDTKRMLDFTCRTPAQNAGLIERRGTDMLKFDKNSRISSKLMVVPSRILPQPIINYKSSSITFIPKPYIEGAKPGNETRKGSWNLRDVQFVKTTKNAGTLGVLHIDNNSESSEQKVSGALKELFITLNKLGLSFNNSVRLKIPYSRSGNESQILKSFSSFLKSNVSYILVVLPVDDKSLYSAVKRVADIQIGIRNSCALYNKFTKLTRAGTYDSAYMANMALKINVKLSGVNHQLKDISLLLDSRRNPFLIMGADVTHPAPGSKYPSIASVVGSNDAYFNSYPGSFNIQTARQERISILGDLVTERLLSYYQKNKTGPEVVLFYRDGISEGQFHMTLRDELPHIRKAVRDFGMRYNKGMIPKLTFMIIVKRHHTRFYPLAQNAVDSSGKQVSVVSNNNVIPGSVIDSAITSPKNFDFYIQSQQALKGTGIPGHYYVLYDENDFRSDTIQTITYNLTHLFVRATKSVKIVPAAYYADLLCERARVYISHLVFGQDENDTVSKCRRALNSETLGVHKALRDVMFYI